MIGLLKDGVNRMFLSLLVLALCFWFQVWRNHKLEKELDLLRQDAQVFEPGKYVVACPNGDAMMEFDQKERGPLCLKAERRQK